MCHFKLAVCCNPYFCFYRDLVHRQTASAVVQHMSLGVYGFGCEDSLNHLLNYVWPNVFETSPHVIQAVMGALEGLRVAIGPCRMLQYCLQVRRFVFAFLNGAFVFFFIDRLRLMICFFSTGFVPPCSQSARRVLEDLQQHLYRLPGCTDRTLSSYLQR